MEKKNKIALVVVIAVVVVAAGVITGLTLGGVITWNSESAETAETNASESLVAPSATFIGLDCGMTMPAGAKVANCTVLKNPVQNEGWYDLIFEMQMEDGTTLWKSEPVKAGEPVGTIDILQDLKPGTYKTYLLMEPVLIREGVQTPVFQPTGFINVELIITESQVK